MSKLQSGVKSGIAACRTATQPPMDRDENIRETRRKAQLVVKQLREHQKEVEDDKAEAVDCRSDALSNHFKKAEQNFGKSQTVDQALIDAQIFHKLGVYSKRQADQLQTGLKTYDLKTFTDNLVTHMRRAQDAAGGGDDDAAICFNNLGKNVWARWRTIPGMPFLYGNEPKDEDGHVQKERKRTEKIRKGTVSVKPSEVKSTEVGQTETDRQIAEMKRLLKSKRSWNYWLFVLDPTPETGFARSIENIFHSSFLIKEKVAYLDMKKKPEMISYIDPRKQRADGEAGASAPGESRSAQLIMGFDRNTWLERIKEYNVTKCALPSRQKLQASQERQQRRLDVADVADDDDEDTAGF